MKLFLPLSILFVPLCQAATTARPEHDSDLQIHYRPAFNEAPHSLYPEPRHPTPATSLAPRDDSLAPSKHLLGSITQHNIYLSAVQHSGVQVQTVLKTLNEHKFLSGPGRLITSVISGLYWAFVNLLWRFYRPPAAVGQVGYEEITIGADDGKGGKKIIRRRSSEGAGAGGGGSWHLADDEVHLAGNRVGDRDVVSEEIRVEMLGAGVKKATVLRQGQGHLLVYEGGDVVHAHWRPAHREGSATRRSGNHLPLFDAGGAGFKISAQLPLNSKTVALSRKDVERVAKLVVDDLVGKRKDASAVGYEDVSKDSGEVGLRMCVIAEDKRFDLKGEMDTCFGKGKAGLEV